MTPEELVPEWDQADKMRKALRHSGVSVQEMANYLGVARNTVSTWINGHIEPSTQTLRLWSIRTGVPYEWLMSATPNTGAEGIPGQPEVRHQGLEPRTRWYAVAAGQRAKVIQFPVGRRARPRTGRRLRRVS